MTDPAAAAIEPRTARQPRGAARRRRLRHRLLVARVPAAFPIDLLKIDGSFIDDDLSLEGWSLAGAIVQICEALGLVAIAEGVETQAQVDALLSIGCRLGQGFHLGRPMPLDQARRLLVATVGTTAHGAE